MSNEASRKDFEVWHSQRAAEIISKGEAIAQEMIKAGCTDSGPTHCSALLTALEQADGTGWDSWQASRKALEAEQAQKDEPIAWCKPFKWLLSSTSERREVLTQSERAEDGFTQPLYTHPAAPQGDKT